MAPRGQRSRTLTSTTASEMSTIQEEKIGKLAGKGADIANPRDNLVVTVPSVFSQAG